MKANLRAFEDAFQAIISISREHAMKMIKEQKENILEVIDLLKSAKENKRIHIAGMGRSKLAGKVLGELLKLLGYNVSIIGETLSRPVREGDIVIAVSASGWTTTTCLIAEEAIRLGAKVIALTATPKSKLDRLSDISLYLPGKATIDYTSYIIRQLIGRHKTPLTPMGTIPETNTILVGMGLAKCLENSKNPLNDFISTINIVLDNAEKSLNQIRREESILEEIIEEVSKGVGRKTPKIYFIGTGISRIIGLMSATRFQHLGINVLDIDDWKFRSKGDILIAISSSGESAETLLYTQEAIRSNLKVLALTANPESTLSKLTNKILILTDFAEREEYIKLRIRDEKPSAFIPAFEYAALITLEGVVAQIAENYNIKEEDMRILHANIE